MVTVPTVQGHRTTLHDRGSWSARDDRIPSAVWLGLLWAGIVGGFGLDIPRFVHQKPPASGVIYVHGFIFMAWLVILTVQVLCVLGDRVAWHKRIGWFAAGWACVMAVFGPWAAMAAQVTNLNTPASDTPFLAINFSGMAGFLALLVWGFALRRNPAAHRRMMILATVAIAAPGFDRISGYVLHPDPHSVLPFFLVVFYGNVLIIVLMAAWDWWKGRLMRSFVWGAAGLLALELLASAIYFWGPWKTVTLAAVKVWMRL